MPADFSISLERHISGSKFLVVRSGFLCFTTVGGVTNAKWYYKEEIDNWNYNQEIPEPIKGNPDHSIYDGFVPYIGVGIRF